MAQFCLGSIQFALRRLKRGLRSGHLCLRREILALAVIDLLLGHQPGTRLGDLVQASEFEMRDLALRLDAMDLVFSSSHLTRGVFDGGLIFIKLHLEFGYFEDGHHLARNDVSPKVDVEFLDKTGLFAEDVNLLEGNELGGNP